jgi:hypothetical protein
MKKAIAIFSFLIFAGSLYAQEPTFKAGNKVVNLGIGFGSVLYTGAGYKTSVPPISASFEYCIKDNLIKGKASIGVGGYLGYSKYKWEYSSDWGYKISNIIIGGRGVFHYALVDKLDTYAGVLVGYKIVSEKEYGTSGYYSDYSSSSSGLITSLYVGGRYYFTDNIAGMAELGYGISWINLGVAVKF